MLDDLQSREAAGNKILMVRIEINGSAEALARFVMQICALLSKVQWLPRSQLQPDEQPPADGEIVQLADGH